MESAWQPVMEAARCANVAQAKQILLVMGFVIEAKSQEKGRIFDLAQWGDVTCRYVSSVKIKNKKAGQYEFWRNPAAKKKKKFYSN